MVPLKGCVHHSCREMLCHLLPFSECLLKMDFGWVQRKVHVFLTWRKETPGLRLVFRRLQLILPSMSSLQFWTYSQFFWAQAIPPWYHWPSPSCWSAITQLSLHVHAWVPALSSLQHHAWQSVPEFCCEGNLTSHNAPSGPKASLQAPRIHMTCKLKKVQ